MKKKKKKQRKVATNATYFKTSRAQSTGLARFLRSRLTTLCFTKISTCSYEKAGWPGYRDLGFCDRDLGNRAGNFSHTV